MKNQKIFFTSSTLLFLALFGLAVGFFLNSGPENNNSNQEISRARALAVTGASGVQYMGRTGSSYTGNLGGIAGANAKCSASYSGSHMCTQDEIVKSGATSFGDNAWVSCTINYTGYQGAVGPTYSESSCGTATEANYRVNAGSNLNCGQWQFDDSGSTGPSMNSIGVINEVSCSSNRRIHCCK